MSDKVQLHVDVPRDLWKLVKIEAMNRKDTLGGVVLKVLEEEFLRSNPVRVAEPVTTKASDVKPVEGRTTGITPVTGAKDIGEVIKGKCSKCYDNFPVTELIRVDPRSTKLFCPDCVENLRNGQG